GRRFEDDLGRASVRREHLLRLSPIEGVHGGRVDYSAATSNGRSHRCCIEHIAGDHVHLVDPERSKRGPHPLWVADEQPRLVAGPGPPARPLCTPRNPPPPVISTRMMGRNDPATWSRWSTFLGPARPLRRC